MGIKIDDTYFIDSDRLQFTLKRSTGKVDDEGKEINESHGYFGTFAGGLKKWVNLKISQSDSNDVKEVLNLLKQLDSKIDDIGKRLEQQG